MSVQLLEHLHYLFCVMASSVRNIAFFIVLALAVHSHFPYLNNSAELFLNNPIIVKLLGALIMLFASVPLTLRNAFN